MVGSDIADNLKAAATGSASNAMGYQVSRLVDMGVNGFLNLIFGQSKEEKLKDMNEHHDRLIQIVEKNRLPDPKPILTPRQSVENDIRESNEHINSAIDELRKAREKAKCGVCKSTIEDTISIVSEKTDEILDASEKVLALQKLKETGQIPSHLTWFDLNRKQKKLVEEVVDQYRIVNNPPKLPDVEDTGRMDEDEKVRKPTRKQARKQRKRR